MTIELCVIKRHSVSPDPIPRKRHSIKIIPLHTQSKHVSLALDFLGIKLTASLQLPLSISHICELHDWP